MPRPLHYLGRHEKAWSPPPALQLVPFITRVRVANYRNLRAIDVKLGPFNVLVGLNGSGKSNFIDALRFLTDALYSSPAQALERRGGIASILSRVPTPTDRFAICVETEQSYGPNSDQSVTACYGFELRASAKRSERPFVVEREECRIRFQTTGVGPKGFSVRRGEVAQEHTLGMPAPQIEPDRLYLPIASANPNLAPLHSSLINMAFYNLDLRSLKRPETRTLGERLGPHGEYLGSVLDHLEAVYPVAKARVDEYMKNLVSDLSSIHKHYVGSNLTVGMDLHAGAEDHQRFSSAEMSDGTLRSAAVLSALFQPWALEGRIPLVAIEEPETSIHPAGAGVLFDAMLEASSWVQVVASSHSGDLLDRDDLPSESVLAISSDHGQSAMGKIDEAGRNALRDALFTTGELLRAGQLFPDKKSRALSHLEGFDVFKGMGVAGV